MSSSQQNETNFAVCSRWMTARMNMQTSCKKPTSFRCDRDHHPLLRMWTNHLKISSTNFHLLDFNPIAVSGAVLQQTYASCLQFASGFDFNFLFICCLFTLLTLCKALQVLVTSMYTTPGHGWATGKMHPDVHEEICTDRAGILICNICISPSEFGNSWFTDWV